MRFPSEFKDISKESVVVTGGTFTKSYYMNPTNYVDTDAYSVSEVDGKYVVTPKVV